jgi:chlorite dismutase
LSRPPECELRTEDAWFLLFDKYSHENRWEQALEQASSEYRHKFSEWHKEHVSCLMKYEIYSMDKGIHHIFIDRKSEELDRVEEQYDEKNTSQKHTFILGFIS